MSEEYTKIKESTLNSFLTPKPGDIWTERLTSIALVIAVNETHMIICCAIADYASDKWFWDFRYINKITIEEFKKRLSYSYVSDKTINNIYGECWPERGVKYLEYFKQENIEKILNTEEKINNNDPDYWLQDYNGFVKQQLTPDYIRTTFTLKFENEKTISKNTKYTHNKTGKKYTVTSTNHKHKVNGIWTDAILYRDEDKQTFSRDIDDFNRSFTPIGRKY